MEQFAANRALYGENLPAADASKSAKHSPSLKKHSSNIFLFFPIVILLPFTLLWIFYYHWFFILVYL